MVILDESTAIKNPTTQISKLCCNGFRGVDHRVILSGMPTPESLLDIYPQMKFIIDTFLGCNSYWAFRAKHFEQDVWTGKWEPKFNISKRIRESVAAVAFTRRRADVKIGSKKIYEERYLTLPPDLMKIYRRTERQFMTEYGQSTQWAIVVQTWLARMTGGFTPEKMPFHNLKFAELMNLTYGELKGEKIAVWFKFNDELREAANVAKVYGTSHFTLLGDTIPEDRTAYLKAFNNTDKYRLALMQLQCAKHGVDASGADTAIYYSNAYSMETRAQSEDRIIHPMKTTPQLIIDFIMKGTVDEDVRAALNGKLADATAFMMAVKQSMRNRMDGE